MPYPGHGEGQALFIAALGRAIEERVGTKQLVEPARVRRVRVKDFAAGIFVENAEARSFVRRKRIQAVVILDFAFGQLVLVKETW